MSHSIYEKEEIAITKKIHVHSLDSTALLWNRVLWGFFAWCWLFIRQCQFLPWKKNKFIFAAWPLAPLSHYFQQRFVSFLNFCPLDNIWFTNCVIAMATTNTLCLSTWRKKISCTMLLDLKELLRIMLIFLLLEFAWSNQICAVSVKNYWGLIELADLAMNRI